MAVTELIARYESENRRLRLQARRAHRGLLMASGVSALMWVGLIWALWRMW